MRIVAADPTDAAAVDLMQALDAETRQRYPGEPVFGIEADGFIERGGVFLLGFLAGSPVACGALRPIDDRVTEIKRLFVRKPFRGRGLSRLLLNRLELIARDAGCRMLRIETGHSQPEALGLYRSVGFAQTKRFGEYVDSKYSLCFAKVVLDADDLGFLRDIETCQLNADQWTHRAHIRMAWLYLTQLNSTRALVKIRSGIKRINADVLGGSLQYHETVTVAFARLISDRMIPGEEWVDFARRIDDLASRSPSILEAYYSKGLIGSTRAREMFVDPDLGELPEFRDTRTN